MSESFLEFKSSATLVINSILIHIASIFIIIGSYFLFFKPHDPFSYTSQDFKITGTLLIMILFFLDLIFTFYLILLSNRFMGRLKYNWYLILSLFFFSAIGRFFFIIILIGILKSHSVLIVSFASVWSLSLLAACSIILISIAEFFINRKMPSQKTQRWISSISKFNEAISSLSLFMFMLPLISTLIYQKWMHLTMNIKNNTVVAV